MPRSITSRQRQLLDTNFLDLTGSSRLDYAPPSLDNLADQLAVLSFEFAELLRDNLNKTDRVASGALSDSIVPTEVQIFGKVFKVDIKMADYYDFVNQGVKGWQDKNGGNSPYQFKQFTGKSGVKNGKMVTAIRKWIIKEGLKGTARENAHPRARHRDQQRAKITDTSTRTAIIISKSIRKNGLKPSHFLTNGQDAFKQRMADELGKALKIDIVNSLIPKS